MEFKPLYFDNKISVINPNGHAGIVTLWTKLDGSGGFKEKLASKSPILFEKNSPLVTLTNLYGLGLPQMLANLAYNPQIERIAITGSNPFGGAEALINFFTSGADIVEVNGVQMLRIRGTDCFIDAQLRPEIFVYKPDIRLFKTSDLEGIRNYITQPKTRSPNEDQRVKVELKMPQFKDFPSDTIYHNVVADTPTEAWMEVLYLLDRYGTDILLEKGKRRALYNLDVNVLNPSFEPEYTLKKLGFNPDELKAYRKEILDIDLPNDRAYSYGHRIGKYWGINALEVIAKRLKEDNNDRHSLVSLWDTGKDLLSKAGDSSVPCFTDAYFVKIKDKLVMSASFRTHNAISAWLFNLYGLRAIQERVAEMSDIEPGQINIRSRWIGIDPENAKAITALQLVKTNRKKRLNVKDPRGFFVVDTNQGEIMVQHFNPDNVLLEEIRGKDVKEVKDKLRQLSAIDNPDHAMWIGYELARAQQKLSGGELTEL